MSNPLERRVMAMVGTYVNLVEKLMAMIQRRIDAVVDLLVRRRRQYLCHKLGHKWVKDRHSGRKVYVDRTGGRDPYYNNSEVVVIAPCKRCKESFDLAWFEVPDRWVSSKEHLEARNSVVEVAQEILGECQDQFIDCDDLTDKLKRLVAEEGYRRGQYRNTEHAMRQDLEELL